MNIQGWFSLIDWFALLAIQGTLKSPLQHHSSKASILWHSAFFMVQLSQLYMTTGKTMVLTIWTFVSRVMSLLFNTHFQNKNISFFYSFKPALSLSSFALIKRLFSSSLLSAIRVVSSTYLKLLMFHPCTLIPACNSSSLTFLMMCSGYRLNKQGGSR